MAGHCYACIAFYLFYGGRRCQSNAGRNLLLLCLPENSLFPVRRKKLIPAPILHGSKKPGAIFSSLNLFILIILKRVLPNECWHKLFWVLSQCFVSQVRLSLSIYFNTFVVSLQIAVVRYLGYRSSLVHYIGLGLNTKKKLLGLLVKAIVLVDSSLIELP